MQLTFFLLVWAGLAYLGHRRRAGFILTFGGSLIAALILLILVVEFNKPRPSALASSQDLDEETSKSPAAESAEPEDAAWAALWRSLSPPPAALNEHSVEELEKLYRRLCARNWNGGLYLEGRRWAGRFAKLAEEWEMHVDLLDGAYYYLKEGRVAAVSKALHAHFENDPQIESAYVNSTAWCGSYTFEAGLRLQGSPKDPELQERARKIAEGLKNRLPSFIGGFKITRVRYEWPQTGTSGNLPMGFLWKRDGDDFRVMNIGNDFHDPQNAVRETRWSQTSWNEGRSVEE